MRLNSLVEAVGHVSTIDPDIMTGTEEGLRDIGVNEFPEEWEDSTAAWEKNHLNFAPSEKETPDLKLDCGARLTHLYLHGDDFQPRSAA